MIPVPSGVKVWLATGYTDMRRGFPGLSLMVQETLKRDPMSGAAICSSFGGAAANYQHSAYGFRFATIAYPWHPLFGRKVQVSPYRRGKSLMSIYTDERPDLSRELPNWMFDERYCGEMRLGPPEISIAGLNELAAALASFGATRARGARSRPSRKKEKGDAKQATSKSRPARPTVGASKG
ncbi:IS66 family insertion sequence element accessory protein TnpB [Sinorhizobium meliloti]|uniref:IS66 family insertion sequence element accessory protein TnpB n=1 Tax=Rhizobium meliloti TaxID=382 RepID=UPI003D64B3BC